MGGQCHENCIRGTFVFGILGEAIDLLKLLFREFGAGKVLFCLEKELIVKCSLMEKLVTMSKPFSVETLYWRYFGKFVLFFSIQEFYLCNDKIK